MDKPRTSRFLKLYRFGRDWSTDQCDLLDAHENGSLRKRRAGRFLREINGWDPGCFKGVPPTSAEMLTGLGRTLSQLPGELRNTIYAYLLSTGHLQFLRASKAIYVEGIGLMAENGVFRVGFGTPERINYILPNQRIVDNIHNVDIHADLS